MKTIDLINILNQQEKEKIGFVLETQGKTELKKLWKHFQTAGFTEEKIDKNELIQQLKDRPVQPSDNQYLRTRLSQLNKFIEHFLVAEHHNANQSEADFSREDTLLRIFLARRHYSLFEKSWNRLFKQAERQQCHDQLAQLYKLYFEYVRYHQGVDIEKLKKVKPLLQKAIQQNWFHFLETHGHLAYAMAYTDRVLHAAGQAKASNAPAPVPELGQSSDWPLHIRFLFDWGESYYLRGEEKIGKLEQLLERHEQTLRFPLEKKQQQAYILATIALEYFFMEAYQDADVYYQKVFKLIGKVPEPYFLDILFNYFSNLLAIGQFRKAAGYFHQYEAAIMQSPKHAFRFQFLAALAHLFLDETSEAFEVMSQEIYQLPEYESVYGRILVAFIYYQWQEYEQTERELQNLLQKIRYKAPPFPDIESTARLFLKFLRLIDKPLDRKAKQVELQGLLEEIDAAATPAHNVFLLKCLRKEVERF